MNHAASTCAAGVQFKFERIGSYLYFYIHGLTHSVCLSSNCCKEFCLPFTGYGSSKRSIRASNAGIHMQELGYEEKVEK